MGYGIFYIMIRHENTILHIEEFAAQLHFAKGWKKERKKGKKKRLVLLSSVTYIPNTMHLSGTTLQTSPTALWPVPILFCSVTTFWSRARHVLRRACGTAQQWKDVWALRSELRCESYLQSTWVPHYRMRGATVPVSDPNGPRFNSIDILSK